MTNSHWQLAHQELIVAAALLSKMEICSSIQNIIQPMYTRSRSGVLRTFMSIAIGQQEM